MSEFHFPQPVLEVSRKLREAGYKAFVTGGGVRDLLLGRTPRDWDLAVSAPAEAIAKLFPRINSVGMRHNTIGIYEGELWIEATTFRDSACSLEGDLGMRDFTINAIAIDPDSGQVLDPLGGRQDLEAGVLRACIDPQARFRDDPLRILRAARFISELGLAPDAAMLKPAADLAPQVLACAVERIRDEWLKLIVGPHIRESFAWMTETGLLDLLFPAVQRTRGVEQNRFHRWDVYEHTVETIARSEPVVEIRLAAMYHDLGKPATRRKRKGDYTFYNHERVSAEIAETDLSRYRFGQRLQNRVIALVANHMFHYQETWTDTAVRRFMRRVEPELIDMLFHLRRADSSASGKGNDAETAENLRLLRQRIEEQRRMGSAVKIADLAINGNDIITLAGQSGPIVGRVLRALLDCVTEKPELNERGLLLKEAQHILNTISPEGKPDTDSTPPAR